MKSEGDSTAAGLKAGASASNSILLHEAAPLFLGGAVEDDADLFEGDEAAVNHFDDGFVERFAVPFVGLADMDAHQGALAFKFLVWHGDSVTLIGRWCPANPEHL